MAGNIVKAVTDQINSIPEYPEDWIVYLPYKQYRIYIRNVYTRNVRPRKRQLVDYLIMQTAISKK